MKEKGGEGIKNHLVLWRWRRRIYIRSICCLFIPSMVMDILSALVANMSPNFSLSFQVRIVGGGMQLVQPVYVIQVLVSYLLFPFYLWKDRNVNKEQGHISWARWSDLATHPSDHVTNEIQQDFEPSLLLTITLSLIPFLLETCFFCSVSLQNPCLFPKFLLH